MRPQPRPREDFRFFTEHVTRWMDNDAYGHLNNAVHYSLFDTTVNRWLHEYGIARPEVPCLGLVVQSGCDYFSELRFPEPVLTGLKVARIGRSSVRYELGLFGGDADLTAAAGHFVHVYVDRQTRRPIELPRLLRDSLQGLLGG